MPNYLWFNNKTEEFTVKMVCIADRDIPPDTSGDWERVLEAANFTRKSYLDGQRKDLQDFKKIAKLGQAAAELPKDAPERNEIQKEITARKQINKKT